ncbi:hypothetical protein E2C01_029400 [Portunus trituberculatus]|uniref:Uncharacterized protein n=1 Tax=Portunus trituberculatus TaxID=210409 RepID=A0A5B7EMV9_PORTR|nr:hypothetical protein [Portunus trituberculatus]
MTLLLLMARRGRRGKARQGEVRLQHKQGPRYLLRDANEDSSIEQQENKSRKNKNKKNKNKNKKNKIEKKKSTRARTR